MPSGKKDHSKNDQKCNMCGPNPCINKSLARCDPFALYSKGMPHDSLGFVDKEAYCKYIHALINKSIHDLNNVPKGGSLKQVDPSASFNDNMPSIVKCLDLGVVPKLDQPLFASNLIEVYNMAYCRDVSFNDYATSPNITTSINSLSQLSEYTGPAITNTTIFRGLSQGDVIGPYISQFLYLDYNEGGVNTFNQRKLTYGPPDFMTTLPNAVSVQNGTVLESFGASLPNRYILNGRDLAIAVRQDEPYLLSYRAMLIMYTLGIPLNSDLPNNPNIGAFINFGKADVVSALGEVTRLAGLACWCYKQRALFIRPEEAGIIVERTRLNSPNNPPISEEITNNSIIDEIFNINNNHLLPQAYPEGCPLHPSWVSGHICFNAAQVTVLKFFFKTNVTMNLLMPDATGQNLVPSGIQSTVRNELDKLISNCGYGRCWAGIHYRIDMQKGVKLGEKVAIEYLRKLVTSYPQKVKVTIKRYNGKSVTIEN